MTCHSKQEPEFYFLGSSSSGNAYIFKFNQGDFSPAILVEAGFTYSELVNRALKNGTTMTDVRACIVTHCHADHAKGVKECERHGVSVYASKGTFEAINMNVTLNRVLTEGEWKYITSSVAVLPFSVDHDAPEPFGFIIFDKINRTKILFINDSKKVNNDLSGIPFDYVFIECNYHDTPTHIEHSNAVKNEDIALIKRYERIMNSHMSLYGCRKTLNSLDLSNCKGIFVMHLSENNAKGEWAKDIRDKIGQDHPTIKVYMCSKNGGLW